MQSVIGGPQRLVALMNSGLGVQRWIGPSWAKGDLFFVKTCDTCSETEATYRYDPHDGIYHYAPKHIRIAGFAMDSDGRRAYQVLGLPGNREEQPANTKRRCGSPTRSRSAAYDHRSPSY